MAGGRGSFGPVYGWIQKSEEKGIAVVKAGCDQRVNQDGSTVGGEGREEAGDVAEVNVG